MLLVSDKVLKEAEERLVLLEKKAATLEHETLPRSTKIFLLVANIFMAASLFLLVLQRTL